MVGRHKWRESSLLSPFLRLLGPILYSIIGLLLVYSFLLANKFGTNDIRRTTESEILSRQKRIVYMDNDRRLSLPPGTSFTFSFIVQFPFWSNLPTGYTSGLTLSVPLSVSFDDLGWTSETNRFGYFDFYGATSWDYSWMDFLGLRHYNWTSLDVFNFRDINMTAIDHAMRFPFRSLFDLLVTRTKRDAWVNLPGVSYDGGDRELIYQVLEDTLTNVGIDGFSCLLRFICEVQEEPLPNYGFFGEVLMLLSSPSLSPLAEYRLGPYLQAEKNGKLKKCGKYRKICKYTFFEFDTRYYRPSASSDEDALDEEQIKKSSFESNDTSFGDTHIRDKRFIMFGPSRRILFPPTTVIVLTPSLSLPFARGLKKGLSSGLSISSPFTIGFDALGYTSSLNHFGHLPFLRRRKRDYGTEELPDIAYIGGDRQLIYTVIEDNLFNLGMNGRACLLKAICQVHQTPLASQGLFGELFQLLLRPSVSPFPGKRTPEYVAAERLGHHCADCSTYDEACPYSLFTEYYSHFQNSDVDLEECISRHSYLPNQENMMDLLKKDKDALKSSEIGPPQNETSTIIEERAIEFVQRVLAADTNS